MKEKIVESKDVSRKDAIKKMGYGALTLSTMMFVLNGTSKASNNDWGNWDDVNEPGLKGASTKNKTPNSGPSVSPELKSAGWDKSSIQVKAAGFTCGVGNSTYAASFFVKNVGRDMQGSTGYKVTVAGTIVETGAIPALRENETYSFTYNGVYSGSVKVRLVVYQRPGHPGGGAWGGPADSVDVDCGKC